jgi:O-methyltransferase
MDRKAPPLFSSLLGLLRRAPRSALELALPRLTEAAPDFTAADRALMARVRPYTMTSLERVTALSQAVRYLVRARTPGAMAECGVWKGGSVMVVALTLLELGEARELFLFDTFDGMTPPTDRDITYAGVPAAELLASPTGRMRCDAGMDQVRRALASTGYPMDRVHLIPGRVEDTLPAEAPDRLALLRLDTDFYASTSHELLHLYPRLSPGGVLILDDYGAWQGARQAVDEYFRDAAVLMHRLDWTGRLVMKPSGTETHAPQ